MKITGVDIYKYTVGYAHGTYVMSGDRVAATEDGANAGKAAGIPTYMVSEAKTWPQVAAELGR